MARTDGRKLVALAAAATVGAIGVGTIYLPFLADRDKLRGMSEEGEDAMPEGARREMKAIMKAEKTKQQQMHQAAWDHEEENNQQPKNVTSGGSMWTSFRRKQ